MLCYTLSVTSHSNTSVCLEKPQSTNRCLVLPGSSLRTDCVSLAATFRLCLTYN